MLNFLFQVNSSKAVNHHIINTSWGPDHDTLMGSDNHRQWMILFKELLQRDTVIQGHISFLRRTCISFSALQSKFSWFSPSLVSSWVTPLLFSVNFQTFAMAPYLWIFHVIIVQEQSEFNYFHTIWLPIFNWSNLHISRRPLHDQDRTWQCGQCHLDPVFHWVSLLAPGHHGKVDT